MPKAKPAIIIVPPMKFIMVDGCGDPNNNPDFESAVQTLYGLSFGIKMLPKKGVVPEGYIDYVVPPLEGLWWINEGEEFSFEQKDNWKWTLMIRQPEFVTEELFRNAAEDLKHKKKTEGIKEARLEVFDEGLCVQMMHIGPYSTEPETLDVMEKFMMKKGYRATFEKGGKHHEIYLSDPRRCAPEKMKTVLRQPVEKIE